jgi:thiosulfate/3-mercaptopyruvate sulfurtransferase
MYSTLISALQLQQINQQNNLVIVDCRHDLMDAIAGQRAYDAGHIPGAVFANLDTQLSGGKFSKEGVFLGRHPLPLTENLIQNLRDLGIHQDSQVVAYDGHGGMYAARLWWLLRSVGHLAAAVLDGGLSAWTTKEYSLQVENNIHEKGDIELKAALTTQVDVMQVLSTILEGRSPDRFRGENETVDPVGGHIPNARNRFFKDNLQADGCFKSAEQLNQEWSSIISNPAQTIMQCGSGVTACHNLLALEIAGMNGAALYPGSWSEWCADNSRPVAVGA